MTNETEMREAYTKAFDAPARFKAKYHEELDAALEQARRWGFEEGFSARLGKGEANPVEVGELAKALCGQERWEEMGEWPEHSHHNLQSEYWVKAKAILECYNVTVKE